MRLAGLWPRVCRQLLSRLLVAKTSIDETDRNELHLECYLPSQDVSEVFRFLPTAMVGDDCGSVKTSVSPLNETRQVTSASSIGSLSC